MKTVTGIFTSPADAERAIQRLRSLGIKDRDINVLAPGASDREIREVRTSDTEQPGMGAALGGVVGGVSGLTLGTAAASLLVPGVGPVAAVGILATALFGAGGAVAGAAAGGALEGSMSDGLPKDELFLYEDALRQGRTVVIALAGDDEREEAARKALDEAGAESIDAARKLWWVGLYDVEKEHYNAAAADGDFAKDEATYRRGFEAALHPEMRGKSYQDAKDHLRNTHPDVWEKDPFRYGYERGEKHYRDLRKED